jgi:F-type H+-transporting ATPase subunit delta
MSNRASAGRYGKALFDVAHQEKLLDQVASELDHVAALVAGHTDLSRTFANPAIPAQLKRNIVSELGSRLALQAPLGKLLLLLAERDRLELLPNLRQEFMIRLNEHRRVLQAEIITSMPLGASEVTQWEQRLSKATGQTVSVTTQTDPTILGGIRARIGSTVFDGSVATQLVRLRTSLVERL